MIAISDEDLMRFADGELSPIAAEPIAALLPHDADLRRRLDVFLVTRAPVAAVFDEVLAEPVPDRLIAAVMRTAPKTSNTPRQIGWTERVRTILEGAVAALAPARLSPAFAAGLAAAVLTAGTVGWLAGRASSPSPLITASAAGTRCLGALAHALEETPSEQPYAASQAIVVPVMSFATGTDGVCREYRIMRSDAGPDFAGLACRTTEGTWNVALHVGTPKIPPANPEKPYETAGGHAVAEIDALAETLRSGDAFGPEDEAERISNAWRAPAHKPQPPAAQ